MCYNIENKLQYSVTYRSENPLLYTAVHMINMLQK